MPSLAAQIEEMAVEAALTVDPRLVFQAMCHDPLTSAVLSLAEIKDMVKEMLARNREHLTRVSVFEVSGTVCGVEWVTRSDRTQPGGHEQ